MRTWIADSGAVVVGAKGMLGTDLLEHLRQHWGERVVGVDLPELDITDPSAVKSFLCRRAAAVIFNCAAYTDVDGCETHRDLAFRVNADGAGNVARTAREIGALLVHVSTDFVFDGKKGTLYTEEDIPHPLSVYGSSKLEGERQILEAEGEWIIARTAWLYGRHGRNFVETVLRLAREKQDLRMVTDQIGSPTYTRDLAEVLRLLVERNCRGIFHAVNTGACSRLEWAREILRLANLPVRLVPICSEEYPRPARVPAFGALSNEKLARETGHRMRPWQDALRDYMARDSSIATTEWQE